MTINDLKLEKFSYGFTLNTTFDSYFLKYLKEYYLLE